MSALDRPDSASSQRSPAAVRLTFAYDGDDVRLLSRQRVEMTIPPGDAVEGHEAQVGFWVEVRGVDGRLLHRRVMHDPIQRTVEVFSDDPEQTVSRVPVQRPEGVFTLVVPDVEDADHVALISSGPQLPGARAAAREIARFPMRPAPPGSRRQTP